MPQKERVLDCVFGVFSVSKNGMGHGDEFWAQGYKHLVEGFHSHYSRPILGKVVELLPYRLARSRLRDPFCSS
jgi:hypothetical protein